MCVLEVLSRDAIVHVAVNSRSLGMSQLSNRACCCIVKECEKRGMCIAALAWGRPSTCWPGGRIESHRQPCVAQCRARALMHMRHHVTGAGVAHAHNYDKVVCPPPQQKNNLGLRKQTSPSELS